jgi:iron complex transport system substrate-binding protein
MERIDIINAAVLAAALGVAASIALLLARPSAPASPPSNVTSETSLVERTATGAPAVRGGDGELVPVADYRRIVSLVPEIDDAFAEMGMVDRLAAISEYARGHSAHARHLRAVPGTVAAAAGVEEVLRFAPDLVCVAAFSDPGRTARVHAAGVAVFHLGDERGAADAALNVRRLAALCAESAAGDELAARFLRRLERIADPRLPRSSACYVGCIAGKLFGGGAGTSYSDVLAAAGLSDGAADAGVSGWLEYRAEDLLRIAPEIIVTGIGMGAAITAMPGMSAVPAVANQRIIEVDHDLLSCPGIAIADAAEAVALARERLP